MTSSSMYSDLLEPFDLPPAFLSHYTSLETFLKIIQSGTLWASHLLYLNDREELVFGVDHAIKAHNSEADMAFDPLPHIEKIDHTRAPDIFVSCFSSDPDNLSQWRGYGGKGQSVSIQFDSIAFMQSIWGDDMELVKVRYGKDTAVKEMRERIPTVIEYNPFRDPPDRPLTKAEILERKTQRIFRHAPKYKNDAFEDEREWRCVVLHTEGTKIEYRAQGSVIVPYVRVPLTPQSIAHVTIGPGSDIEWTKQSVEKFLADSKFKHVKVGTTTIPFRT